ncbi:hypothetical protein CLIB1423_28S00254 [[Candida] railenensis]|uniref:Uncharacterized protein n=1 Tax=[Candida] railenensis TaxID=45579 RepID=A0A9P0QVW2_9ASCO|nr:hypothetical protein CLIB1423_28S00254 [[Candida] railenensis]
MDTAFAVGIVVTYFLTKPVAIRKLRNCKKKGQLLITYMQEERTGRRHNVGEDGKKRGTEWHSGVSSGKKGEQLFDEDLNGEELTG